MSSRNARRASFYKLALGNPSLTEYMNRIRAFMNPNVREYHKVPGNATRVDGPMVYLAHHIVEGMAKAGYPAKVFISFRSPEQQEREWADGDSKARAWQSPHQFWEAVDIVHPSLYWEAPKEFWTMLGIVTRQVAQKYRCPLVWGGDWGWDFAHIEIRDWRQIRSRQEQEHAFKKGLKQPVLGHPYYEPSPYQRNLRFIELIPREYWTPEQRKNHPAKKK